MSTISKIVFDSTTKFQDIQIDLECSEVYIDKSAIGKDDNEKVNHNFLAVGRKNQEAKKLIALLSNHRFFLTSHKNGISLFKKFDNAHTFITSFNNKSVRTWNDTFYTLEEPLEKDLSNARLLVIFSSIADLAFNASIDRRMFFKNFPTVAEYIPKNTYILRIADIGGVLGGFYLNSHADMQFESKVNDLIRKIQLEKLIPNENIVLYGTLKGATGALYHGIKMGLSTLAVDPIISDEYYLHKFNDLHFVTDVFPESKQEKFARLFLENKNEDLSHIKLVTSPNSEQFGYINELILIPKLNLKSFIFSNPNIKAGLDIENTTIHFITSMLNNLLYNIDVKNDLITTY